MDEVDRLIQAFRARARASVVAKLDVLMDIERLDDPRVVPFPVGVLAHRHEATEVRRHLLALLRHFC